MYSTWLKYNNVERLHNNIELILYLYREIRLYYYREINIKIKYYEDTHTLREYIHYHS